jgi:energy-coupling factor transport system permease protein
MAMAASQTTNPVLLGLVLAVVGLVVASRRSDEPWARGYRGYLLLGLCAVGVRLVFRALLGGGDGTTVLLRLPELPLPSGVGFRIGGAVTLEGLVAAAVDGLRLAVLLACIGAANVLADPRRLLRSVPAALHEIGVAVTVALTVAPQLIESGQRVRRAQRLRGATGAGRRRHRVAHVLRRVAVPVLADALERSLSLAASMDGRGYGRVAHATRGRSRLAAGCTLAGLCGLAVGTYGVLDASAPRSLGVPAVVFGLAFAVVGMVVGGRQVRRTTYRPDPWRAAESVVVASGFCAAVTVVVQVAIGAAVLHPSTNPLVWPAVPVLAGLGILVGLVPAVAAPPPALVRPSADLPSIDARPGGASPPLVAALRRGPA